MATDATDGNRGEGDAASGCPGQTSGDGRARFRRRRRTGDGSLGNTTTEGQVIAGVELTARPDAVWVRSATPLHVLASAVVGGELDTTRHIVNMHVPEGYGSADPAADLRVFARRSGIAEPFVGLMTAVLTDEAQHRLGGGRRRSCGSHRDGGAQRAGGCGSHAARGVAAVDDQRDRRARRVVRSRGGGQRRDHAHRGQGRGARRGRRHDGGGGARDRDGDRRGGDRVDRPGPPAALSRAGHGGWPVRRAGGAPGGRAGDRALP